MIVDDKTQAALANSMIVILEQLDAEQRLWILDKILENFCIHCGTDKMPCYCWNDE